MKTKKPIFIIISLCIIIFATIQITIIITPFRESPKKSDTIIVLGAKLYGDKPGPMLQYRLEKTLELYNKGYGDKIIVSGAQGHDELVTEAFAMKKYLVESGVPEDIVFEEDNSYSTYQNLYYSNKIMKKKNLKTAIIVTNKFHIGRSLMIADRLNIVASGAPTKNIPNLPLTIKYYIREVLAYIKDFILVR